MEDQICEHLTAVKKLKHAKDYVCEECVKHNGTWLHLPQPVRFLRNDRIGLQGETSNSGQVKPFCLIQILRQ